MNCFVVMGFGKKTDYTSTPARTLDLDKTYKHLVQPVITGLGIECIRADEIKQAGMIDAVMYQHLLAADLVVADISTANANAIYELGVRHALRPSTTVVIAEDGMRYPFDVNHIAISSYRHLGDDIGASEVERFRPILAEKVRAAMAAAGVDSPVYTFLPRLQAPSESRGAEAAGPGAAGPPGLLPQSVAELREAGEQQLKEKRFTDAARSFAEAQAILRARRGLAAGEVADPHLVHREVLATYKAPGGVDALRAGWKLLAPLKPDTSLDPETLGLAGAIQKRLYEATRDPAALELAIAHTERGFYLKRDYYNGINLAFLLDVRADHSKDPDEAQADQTVARRVRREVLRLCGEAIAQPEVMGDELYWVEATRAEAKLGLGEEEEAASILADSIKLASKPFMVESTRDQMGKLRALLDKRKPPAPFIPRIELD